MALGEAKFPHRRKVFHLLQIGKSGVQLVRFLTLARTRSPCSESGMRKKRQSVLLFTALSVAFGLFITANPLFAAGQENVLYSFQGNTPPRHDGADPNGNLIFDTSGNLYGATNSGGVFGSGTVFELKLEDSGGWTKMVLHNFAGNVGGYGPVGNLIFDGSGNLYGTTVYGGSTYGSGCGGDGCGTAFQLTLGAGGRWTYRVIHNFGKGLDGEESSGGLAVDAAGNLYGFTTEGGALGGGAVYQLTPGADGQWTEKVLYNFSGGVDWQEPLKSLMAYPPMECPIIGIM